MSARDNWPIPPMPTLFDPERRAVYERDGYVMIRNLFDAEETALLRSAMENDPQVRGNLYDRLDAEGLKTKMVLWNHPGDSVYGLAARSERVVDTMEDMLGGEVYHYHSKLTAKEPHEGGAWEWHQDYGYWYNNGCLFPLMASVMVALDKSTRANGCLQVVRGSHHLGRIDHGIVNGAQVGADPRRVDEILKQMEIVYAEMEPGDGLFFHSNVLHRSDQNRSPDRRWTVLMCYNAARNNPYREHHHPFYTPLAKVPDSAIKQAGLKFASGGSSEDFKTRFHNPPELQRTIVGDELSR
jgi:ectoine hydroxylase